MAWSLVVSLSLQLAPPAAVATHGSPPAPSFALEQVAPHFSTGKAQAGVAMLRLDRAADAAALFGEALKSEKKSALPLKFLLATAQLRAGRAAEAARLFDELRGQYALLADYVLLGSARAHATLGHLEDARARLAALSPGSPLAADAQLIEAELRTKQGQLPEAAELLSSYLTKYPDSWRSHEIRARLARTLDSAGKKQAAEAEWKKLYVDAPHESYGQEAAQHLPDRTLPADEKQRRAMALFDGMRNKESEEEWKQLLALPTPVSEPDQCVARFHLAQSVFKQRDRGRAAPLFDEARVVCEKAKNEDLLVKSIYQAGRSYGSRGPKEPALMQKGIERFGEIVANHKDHSYADDALVRRAELVETLGHRDESKKLLGEVAARFPGGDQRGEALWRLAFAALREKDYATADKWLAQALTELPRQDGWWEAGRTLYWLGRSAELRGEKVKSIDYYQRTAREYPLAYYALFALNRLRGLDAPTYEKLVAPWIDVDDKAPTALAWPAQPLFAAAGWARATELLRLGLGTEAKRELYQLGLAPPKRGTPVAPTDEEKLWLATALLDAAGQWAASHAIPRYFVTRYSKSWPVGAELRRWLLSYPRGYADLVEPATKENGFPPELEFAIIREESAFDPLMESFANAVGLTQLTADPAKRFAQGLPHDRAALRIPSINVPIGARELGHLVKTYAGNFPLAIAGYNAGEGAVNRWLRDPERNDGNLDLFLEAIPYDETRGYTKRVLSSYFAYAWLAGKTLDERVPKLVAQTPRR